MVEMVRGGVVVARDHSETVHMSCFVHDRLDSVAGGVPHLDHVAVTKTDRIAGPAV